MSRPPKQADLEGLLEALGSAGVEFIVVGGAAAVLHGAPVSTVDVDIVHRTTPENVDRLVELLQDLEARIRDPAGRTLVPSRPALLGSGQINLITRLGPLDLLCRLDDGRDYDQLRSRTVDMTDGSMRLTVLDLDTLIEIKASTGRARDRLVVPILVALKAAT